VSEPGFAVMDVGGTHLRTGIYQPGSGRLEAARRVLTDGIALHPGDPEMDLQQRVTEQIVTEAAKTLCLGDVMGLGVAFAGPVTATGSVLAAPTIWGGDSRRLDLADLLRNRLGVPVTVVNDLTAAVWRYVRGPDEPPFCLLTISSGIGNKVYWGGRVLIDDDGYGGELGHWACGADVAIVPCDCGGSGHLGAVASGRGVLAAARAAGLKDLPGYQESALGRSVFRPADLSNEVLAAAIRDHDVFGTDVLRASLRPLAQAIMAVFFAIGVRRFRIIGGFAQAIGSRYAQLLTEALQEIGGFGLTAADIDQLVTMGHADDDHSLIGAGRMLVRTGTGIPTGEVA